jgi:multisubunit Na+/H+ antiporter MnhC subunit
LFVVNQRTNLILGGLLLLGGFFLLLVNFDIFGDLGPTVWGLFFVVGGLVFVALYLGNRQHWWPIIPGLTLVGVGALVLLSGAGLEGEWLPSVLFGAIAAAFLVVYLSQPAVNWWAIIPGGVMASLALVLISGDAGGAVDRDG